MIKPYSENYAHIYRGGIIGCLAFGGCGVHVPCCIAVWLLKRFYRADPAGIVSSIGPWMIWFLVPATVIFIIFFLLTAIYQIKAFANSKTPYPKWCWIFSVLFGVIFATVMRLIGDHAVTNALATGWISIGNLWMMSGLLIMSRGVRD